MNQTERRRLVPPSKAQLDALLDAAVDAIVLIGVDGHITLFNRAAEHMFGYDSAEVVGQNVKCLMPQPYRSEHDGYLKRYLKTGQARIIGVGREVMGQRKDGSTFPMELSVGEVRHKDQHGFVGILRDISNRKALEDQIRQQGDELRLIFESAPTAIAVVTLDNELLNCNRSWNDLLAYDGNEEDQLSFRDIIHPEDYVGFSGRVARLKEGAEDTCRMEVRLLKRTGETLHAQAQVGVIRGEEGARFVILELVDRTAQTLAEQEVKQLRENVAHIARVTTMGEMATGIAHELNQPLTAIGTYAQAARRLIESGAGAPAEIVETLGKISAQSERAGEVIRRLRAMLVRSDVQREATDSAQLIRDIVRLAEIDLRDRSLTLRLRMDEPLPRIWVDRVQIQQVILNLLRNAMEAMSVSSIGNEVVITAHVTDNRTLRIDVSDSGPGISDSEAARIFEAFYTTKSEGLGMGLAICRSILQAHEGSLQFSNNPNGGATFTMFLPVDEDEDHDA